MRRRFWSQCTPLTCSKTCYTQSSILGFLVNPMRRREFFALLGGAAAAWPVSVLAQQSNRVRHIGMLVGFDDPGIKAFQQELERLGWLEGRNIHIEYRYAPAGSQVQTLAKEL